MQKIHAVAIQWNGEFLPCLAGDFHRFRGLRHAPANPLADEKAAKRPDGSVPGDPHVEHRLRQPLPVVPPKAGIQKAQSIPAKVPGNARLHALADASGGGIPTIPVPRLRPFQGVSFKFCAQIRGALSGQFRPEGASAQHEKRHRQRQQALFHPFARSFFVFPPRASPAVASPAIPRPKPNPCKSAPVRQAAIGNSYMLRIAALSRPK